MLAAEAYALAILLRVALRLLPLRRVVTALARLPRSRDHVTSAADCARAAADATRAVAHPTCLFTSLTAFGLLARRGYAARLVIGAAADDGFDAHAWVTVEGVSLVPSAGKYSPLWSYDVTPGAR